MNISVSRREFLYYVWAASMSLMLAEAGGAVLWLGQPRFKPGEFGGVFTLDLSELPLSGSAPKAYDAGRFWLVNVDEAAAADPRHPAGFTSQPGLLALYKICVHLGCLYQWKPTDNLFACPCHGSKYLKDGVRVHQPANRNLDVFIIRAIDSAGNILAETKTGEADSDPTVGQPLRLPSNTVKVLVDTGQRLHGRHNDSPHTVA